MIRLALAANILLADGGTGRAPQDPDDVPLVRFDTDTNEVNAQTTAPMTIERTAGNVSAELAVELLVYDATKVKRTVLWQGQRFQEVAGVCRRGKRTCVRLTWAGAPTCVLVTQVTETSVEVRLNLLSLGLPACVPAGRGLGTGTEDTFVLACPEARNLRLTTPEAAAGDAGSSCR